MPIARFQMPDGRVARFDVPEGTTPEQAQAAFQDFMATQKAVPEQVSAPAQAPASESAGIMSSIGNFFTGADRETRATRELPELTGILSGLDVDPGRLAGIAAAGALTTDPMELANIIKSAAPDVIGIQQDEKGNVLLANNQTGARVVVNKPGVSQQDLINLGALGAAFTPAGRAVTSGGLGVTALTMGGRAAATQAGIEALQAGTGGEFNPGEVALAGGLGAGTPVLSSAVKRAYQSATSPLRQAAGGAEQVVTPPSTSPAAPSAAPASQQQAQESVFRQTAEAARATGRKAIPTMSRLASEVQPDETILQAAERLGVRDQLIPSQYSRSQAYREIEQGLASIPGSQLNEQQKSAAAALAQRADDYIQAFNGTVDKSQFSETFKANAMRTIEGLDEQSSKIYASLREAIPQATEVSANNTLEYLGQQAAELGGEKYLSARMRKLLRDLSDNPTYGRLDYLRREIGQGMRGSGAFKDAEQGQLKRLYSVLLDDQGEAAAALGQQEAFNAARGLVAQRKAIEDDMVALLGKDLSGAITSKLGGAIRNLGKGDYKQFDQIMSRIPPDMRQQAIFTSINDAFTAGSRAEKQLSAPGFVDWYEGLMRNEAARNRIEANIPQDARRVLKDIFQVARGMREASRERITTGRIAALTQEFAQPGGMLAKLWDGGKSAAAAEGVTTGLGVPGVGAASVIASRLSRPQTPLTKAADQLLSSPEFKAAVNRVVAESGNFTGGVPAAERAVTKTPAYREWLSRVSPEVRGQIKNTGFLMWLTGPSRSETTTGTETEQRQAIP